MLSKFLPTFLLASLFTLCCPAFASAAERMSNQGYWIGFRDYWFGMVRKQDNMVVVVVLIGLLCIFILTRGKWKK
jgi:hypothetical protein